ncbi:MAG: hypothetical protein Q8N77_06155 [Nanoarchaeota archaeon]|nr:hypothetical protein [Nanoarchaeota archaeon]
MKLEISKALVIAFVLIAGLIAFNFLSYTGFVVKDEEWVCSQYACDKMITAEEWIKTNCYTLPDGSNQQLCKVIIDGKEQLVPLDKINQQALNQCTEVRCVQEVKARPADYKVDLQKLQNQGQQQTQE